MSLKVKARLQFGLIVATALIFISCIVLLSGNAFKKVAASNEFLSEQEQNLCGCSSYTAIIEYPGLLTVSGLILITVLLLALYGVMQAVVLHRETRSYIKQFTKLPKVSIARVHHLQQKLAIKNVITVVEHQQPIALCYGLIAPKIIISTTTVMSLKKRELEAVLRHEYAHCRVYEPLKLFISTFIAKALWFMPGLNQMKSQYEVFAEVSADQYATHNFSQRKPLAQALSKLLTANPLHSSAVALFASYANQRLEYLVQPHKAVSISIASFMIWLSSLAAALLPVATNAVLFENPALPEQYLAGYCQDIQVTETARCQMILESTEQLSMSLEHQLQQSIE